MKTTAIAILLMLVVWSCSREEPAAESPLAHTTATRQGSDSTAEKNPYIHVTVDTAWAGVDHHQY